MPAAMVAGVDCSTQATKVLVIDADDGRVVASGRAPHVVTGSDGARETDPSVWWRALAAALAETGRAADVGAISVAGQQHGLVVLDGRGRPLRPAILWNDTRSAPDAAALTARLGGPSWWAARVGSVPVASFTVTSWAWLRRTEPDLARAVAAVRLPHDYLTGRLSGRAVTDRGDVSGTGWWATGTEEYAADVLARVELDPALLPDVFGPTEPAGEVTTTAAADLGLARGTLVGPGTGDNMGAALGLGLDPGTPVVSLGTSGTAYAVSTARTTDESGAVAGFADATGRFLPLTATLNCTVAVDRFAAWLGRDREDVADRTDVVVLPYLDGERTPNLPEAAGSILGLRHDTDAGAILLGAYEGAALGLIDALDAIDAAGSGLDPDAPLLLIGGGAQGTAWRHVVGRLSGRRLEIPATAELVAIGAAVQAAAVLRGEDPLTVARRWETRRGTIVAALPRDDETLERIREVRRRAGRLNESL